MPDQIGGGGGVTVGAAIFQTLFGLYQSGQESKRYDAAAAEAERIGQQNAAAIESETQERLRITKLEQSAKAGTARARAAASGTVSGSLISGITTLTTEQSRQLEWMKVSGASQARSARTTGAYAASTARSKASTARASGISEALSGGIASYKLGKKHTDWWG